MGNIKKFEDFLDKMQGLLDNAKKQGYIIVRVEDIENTFPELKESESEDERVRKKVIEYMKTGTYNRDYIRYAGKYSHEIWRKLMDNFKNIKDYHIGCNEVSDIVLNAIIDTFNWLEKGGDKNKVSKHVEAINEEKVDDANKVEPKGYNSNDPHFFKTTDKVEPKFKVGG